jgi:hypothetical protein
MLTAGTLLILRLKLSLGDALVISQNIDNFFSLPIVAQIASTRLIHVGHSDLLLVLMPTQLVIGVVDFTEINGASELLRGLDKVGHLHRSAKRHFLSIHLVFNLQGVLTSVVFSHLSFGVISLLGTTVHQS